MTPTSETIAEEVRRRYTRRTPGSLQLHEAAKEHLPGGDTRTINHFTPYPTFMERGDGCTLVDVDDNVYIDFNNNMSAVAHGHGHPALVAAAAEQYPRGVALGAPNAGQARLAGVLRSRVPSMDKVRFCSTGTEATMLALQTARAFTKRDVIAKIDGGYHGFHNDVRFNMFTGMTEPAYPQPGLPESFPPVQVPRGVPYDYMNDVAMVPYNDLDAAKQLFGAHADRIAALIVEPMMGAAGCVPGREDYLHGLRELTTAHGVLLVFDECATFRMGPLQNRLGIAPDLTTLSKIVGGGLPFGAFGGREDVMAQYDPTRPDPLYHAGALAGNNLAMTVGLAAMDTFGLDEVARLNGMGERIAAEIPAAARDVGVKLSVTGVGSLAHLHWGEGSIANAREAHARRANLAELPELLHLGLLNRGVYMSRRGLFALSMPMTEDHVTTFVATVREALDELRPYIADRTPHLLRDAGRG